MAKKNKQHQQNCYCGGSKKFEQCCQPFIDGLAVAETAEQLMRSRYTAYVTTKVDYLKSTWLSSTCPIDLTFDSEMQWLRLDVLAASEVSNGNKKATVEFKAWFIQGQQLLCMHERSHFVRQQSCWFYSDGQQYASPAQTISLNQDCPCNSGNKFKRCCYQGS